MIRMASSTTTGKKATDAPKPTMIPATAGLPRTYPRTASIMKSTAHRSQDWKPTSTTTGDSAMTSASVLRLPLNDDTTATIASHTRASSTTERSR